MWGIEVIKKINNDAAEALDNNMSQRIALENAVQGGMSPTKMLWFNPTGKPPKDNAGVAQR